VLAFVKRAVKKVLTSLERNVLAFAEEAVKKVLASLDMCLHLEKELLKKSWQT